MSRSTVPVCVAFVKAGLPVGWTVASEDGAMTGKEPLPIVTDLAAATELAVAPTPARLSHYIP